MESFESKLKSFAVQLYNISGVKFGDFRLKTGMKTPVYCDLRVLISYPDVMDLMTDLMIERLTLDKKYDLICGVPYAALSMATVIAMKTRKPMVMRRQEAKSYGTKKLIEGKYNEGDKCLIVEDVVVSGACILETVRDLKLVGLTATDVVVLLDREQGGDTILKNRGIQMHALLTMTELVSILKDANCITDATAEEIKSYVANNQVTIPDLSPCSKNRLKISYEDRVGHSANQISTRLFNTMIEKQSNLCIAADLTTTKEVLHLAKQAAPYICMLKLHSEMIEDYSETFIEQLKLIAQQQNFLLFEDRKFSEVGKVLESQVCKSFYRVSSWANVISCHSLAGKQVLDEFRKLDSSNQLGVFLLAESSSNGSLIDGKYTSGTVKLAAQNLDVVTGVVCHNPLFLEHLGMIQITFGEQLSDSDISRDNIGCIELAVENGADIVIVRNGATNNSSLEGGIKECRKVLWDAYLRRIK